MKTKIIGILVCMLLIATVLPAVVTMNINNDVTKHIEPQPISTSVVWSDDFDSYAAGSLLHGQGGWEAWDLITEYSPYVSDEQSRSAPNSVELKWDETWSDIVHMFYGVNSGQWTITAWWFLPEEFTGGSNFVLHNKYEHNNHVFPRDNSVIIQADSFLGTIYDRWEMVSLPMIRDEWVEIRIEIDFELDTYDAYYNNTFLGSGSWTRGEGQKNLGCIDLCNDGTSVSNATYFDDISLEGDVSENADLYCEGDITLTEVEPGATIEESFIVQNSGAEGTLLDWEIESTPDWGEWSFEPNEGTDLESWSPITIDVEIVAPEDPNTEFTGEIKIVNSEDPDDYCIIDVSLATPVSQQIDMHPLFQMILERFPNAFPILRYMLGL